MRPPITLRISVILASAMVCLLAAHAELQAERAFETSNISAIIDADSTGGNGANNGLHDQFRVLLNGADVQVYIDGNLSQSYVLSSLDTLTIEGSGDDDALIVDFGQGNPVPSGGLSYNGLGNSSVGDTLKLTDGSFASVSHKYFSSSAGAIDLDGSIITYTGLEPVIDLVPATTLTVNGTNAHNAITYSQGSVASNGLVAVDNFETIEFSNKTNLVINGQGGNDDIVINNAATPTNLASITVNCENGDDSVYVAFESPVNITINGDEGDDVFKVHPSSNAVIQVNGGNHVIADKLHVNRHRSPMRLRRYMTDIYSRDYMNIPYTDIERFDFHAK